MNIYIKVFGKVQGVFFRKYTQEKAVSLGLKGYVENCTDGCVFIHASGMQEALEALVDWCHLGSPSSRVDRVEVLTVSQEQEEPFSIRR